MHLGYGAQTFALLQLEPHGYSSLYHDLTSGRRLELEALHGAVVRLGHKHGVEVPASQAVYAILKPWENRVNIGTAS